jgi:hypothetical protein
VLKKEDYERAKQYVAIPEELDFYRILEWDYDPKAMLRP